jgi:hypothetical protein
MHAPQSTAVPMQAVPMHVSPSVHAFPSSHD